MDDVGGDLNVHEWTGRIIDGSTPVIIPKRKVEGERVRQGNCKDRQRPCAEYGGDGSNKSRLVQSVKPRHRSVPRPTVLLEAFRCVL